MEFKFDGLREEPGSPQRGNERSAQAAPLAELLVHSATVRKPVSQIKPIREVRPEYNIGKFAGVIFVSPYAAEKTKPRSFQWRVMEGDKWLDASITVTPLAGQTIPTSTTLRVFLALLQVWEQSGSPENGIVQFSARQLCDMLGWQWAGSDTATNACEPSRT